ncbi:MAG: Prolipoprotein diacylglyceryl transferase [Acetothermia bacterium 64_32]|nr:MAG: Prolipoprotein diacylglyceryl transferase [Acetothermia bacterium 64_32]MBC7098031.1 prolipoprotein diacylglyceryl transferase [Candidatus Bipolaricaulota bacterium]HAF70180.1 prolipoprotein diacylglyceryl transferase [Candidatus Acetothermia bacterium]
MHPVFLRIGQFELRYYGLMYVIAFVVGFFLIRAEARRRGLPLSGEDVLDLFLVVVPLGLVFARAYYVAFKWDWYREDPWEIFKLWHGGLAIHGGLLGGGLALWLFSRWKRVRPWALADTVAPALILGQALGRIGNLLNGDAYGVPTSLPWGIVFPPGSPAGEAFPGQPLHPTMLYEFLGNLILFGVLWRLRRRPAKDGFLACLYFMGYSVVRGLVSCVRGDSLWLGPIRAAHLASGVLFLAFGAWLLSGRLWQPDQPGECREAGQPRQGSR